LTAVHAILIVIIRVWAASALLSGIATFSQLLALLLQNTTQADGEFQTDIYFVLSYGTSLFWIVAGAGAWIAAPWFARKIYPVIDEGIQINVSAETLVAIGGFLIGGFILITFLPRLFIDIGWWISYLAEEKSINESELISSGPRFLLEWRSTISNLVTVLIAAWMALRPSDIARIFSWLRHAGQYEEKE